MAAEYASLHPRIVELGALFASHSIVGTNARCLSMIAALRSLISDSPVVAALRTFQAEEVEKATSLIQYNAEYVSACRELPVGVQTIVKTLRDRAMRHSGFETRGETPRQYLLQQLDELEDDFVSSFEETVQQGLATCVKEGDVILTFGRSSAIEMLLRAAFVNTSFSVIVVDSAPMYEGRGLFQRLQQAHIKVTYVLLQSVCTAVPRCTRVLIGASAVMQNGEVQSRAGTAMVALVAYRYHKPVMCLCETYKFTPKVRLGSLTVNNQRMGPSSAGSYSYYGGGGAPSNSTAVGASSSFVCAPAPVYDLTPPHMVSMFVTEVGMLHPTAVAAVVFDRDDRESKGGQ